MGCVEMKSNDLKDRSSSEGSKTPPSLPLQSVPSRGMPSVVFGRDLQKWKVGAFLGKGTWAIVHEGIDMLTMERYAIKSYDKKKISPHSLDMTARREVRILRSLRPEDADAKSLKHVCNLIESVEDDAWLHLIVDLGKPEDLQEFVNKEPLCEADAKILFRQLLKALAYVHASGVCHRDIKPGNILFAKSDNRLLLTDFALGAFTTREIGSASLKEVCGTPEFVAPEVGNQPSYDGAKADMWSCGVTLYTILLGKTPWHSSSHEYRVKKEMNGDHKALRQSLSCFSPALQDLMNKLLSVNPSRRPTAQRVLNHPWLSDKFTF
ncbi:CBL-interacting serine/threonine-protein kinase 20 [Diplonema papillatum]|nr:CBL-interacting serine/threonine-protein kinase 20 [Diplonema papillatum]|eukprot:gene15954-24412_t